MALNQELVNHLRELDLNQYEARAYLALSSSGASTAGELSELAELPRPRVYDVLKGLQDKGFVALKPGRPVKYTNLPIGEAIKTLRNQRQTHLEQELKRMEQLGGTLATKLERASPPSRIASDELVWTLRGREAIYSKLATMIAGAKEHVAIASSNQGALRKLKTHQKELEICRQRGAKVHVVCPGPLGEAGKLAHVYTKAALPTRMVLADEEAFLFLTPEGTPAEDELGVWMKSPHITSTLRTVTGNFKG